MQLLMLTLALIAAGRKVESRTADTRRATRQGSQLNHPTSRPTTHFNKKGWQYCPSLTPEGDWAHLRSTACLAKFGESEAIEARGDKVPGKTVHFAIGAPTDTPIVHTDCTELRRRMHHSPSCVRSHQLCSMPTALPVLVTAYMPSVQPRSSQSAQRPHERYSWTRLD